MNQRLFLATFEDEADILAATHAVRRRGLCIADVYAPYPVHGLPEAMDLRPSRLPWACFIFGLTGGLIALTFQQYLSAVDWPLNVGGKPWNSIPAFIPVAFELTVLFAGLGSVAALFARYKLWPGRKPRLIDPRSTDDRFVLVLVQTDAAFDVDEVTRLCRHHGAVHVEERIEGQTMPLEAA